MPSELGPLVTYGEAVVDEGVDGADPEDEESPDQLPGRLVPEHGPVVLEVQHGAGVGLRHCRRRGRASLRLPQGRREGGPPEREHVGVRLALLLNSSSVQLINKLGGRLESMPCQLIGLKRCTACFSQMPKYEFLTRVLKLRNPETLQLSQS